MDSNTPALDLSTPTTWQYGQFDVAYRWFNDNLFDLALPTCLITMTRKARTLGYFSGNRWAVLESQATDDNPWATSESSGTDEIAMHPEHFADRSAEEVLSTLVHEMVHCWQAHYGKPPRRGYHSREWADRMEEVGLVPSHTGQPDGKKVGQRMTHYIVDGPFRSAAQDIIGGGWAVPYFDLGLSKKPSVRQQIQVHLPDLPEQRLGQTHGLPGVRGLRDPDGSGLTCSLAALQRVVATIEPGQFPLYLQRLARTPSCYHQHSAYNH